MKTDVSIRRMTEAEVPLGMELKALAGWNQIDRDWTRFLRLCPDGCFVARVDDRDCGTAVTTIFDDKVGWISMILVHPDMRRRGLGTALMDACIVQMGEGLQAAAKKASHDRQANEYLEAAGQIHSRQRVIWHQMAASLQSPLKPEPKGAPGAALSVVDKNEFEEWLAVRVMVTRADTRYRGDLLQLKLRLDHLQVANRTGHHNPLGPALVSEAFHNALGQLNLSRDVEKICLKVFELTVLKELGPMYRELNNILIRHGVLPDLDLSRYLSEQPEPRPTNTPPEPKPAEEPKPAVDDQQNTADQNSDPANRPTGDFRGYSQSARTAFATVRNLLSTLQARRAAAGEPATGMFPADARPLSPGELYRDLQELQLQVVGDEDEASGAFAAWVIRRVARALSGPATAGAS